MKKLFFFVAVLALPATLAAQRYCTIGDTLPSSENYTPDGKTMVILDFWHRFCGGCIEAFPKNDSLQREFDGKIKFLLVNTEPGVDSSKLSRFVSKFNLKYLVADTMLRKNLLFVSVPHYVWLNPYGKIIAITTSADVNRQNIRAFLNGRTEPLYTKKSIKKYRGADTLQTFTYRTTFSWEQPELHGGLNMLWSADGKSLRKIAFINYQLKYLMNFAWPQAPLPPHPKYTYEELVCYELFIPEKPMSEVKKIIQEDLRRYLGIKKPGK